MESSVTQNPSYETPLEPLRTDDFENIAAEINSALDQNHRVSPVAKLDKTRAEPSNPSPGKDAGAGEAWRKEPLSNFVTDDSGNVKLRNGKPVRRGGKPAKPKPGDKLADGSTFGVGAEPGRVQSQQVSRVVVPGQAEPGDLGPSPGSASGVECGPEAGRVVSDLVFNVATAKGGPKWRPTDDERAFIQNAAGAATNGRRIPWALALVLGIAAYIVVRIELPKPKANPIRPVETPAKPKETPSKPADEPNPHSGNRTDSDGQDNLSPTRSTPVIASW